MFVAAQPDTASVAETVKIVVTVGETVVAVPVVGLAKAEGVQEKVKGTVLAFVAVKLAVVPAHIVAGLNTFITLSVVIFTAAKPGPPPVLLYLTSTVLVGLINPL